MRIDHYSFGSITIDGKEYSSDVIIYSERVDSSWWRQEGHNLEPADLTDIVKAKPDILIVGTGFYGVMSVPEETLSFLKSHGLEVQVMPTKKAVELFNDVQGKAKSCVAALHLTC